MNDRKGFGSNFGFLMAAVGSAVGLGNIWGFPNKMGANGGFPFLILYLALALCCGVIIMLRSPCRPAGKLSCKAHLWG